MTEEELRNLLLAADANAPATDRADDNLAQQVRRMSRRRRAARAVGGLAVACILIAVGIEMSGTGRKDLARRKEPAPRTVTNEAKPQDRGSDPERLRLELAQLNAVAEGRLTFVAALNRGETAGSSSGREPDRDATTWTGVQQELDDAAFVLVYQGDRLRKEYKLNSLAEGRYRRVIELFPGTSSATIARQRLADRASTGD